MRLMSFGEEHVQGCVQQLTGLIGLSIGPAYVRPVSCWTAFIVIQQSHKYPVEKMAAIAGRRYTIYVLDNSFRTTSVT